MRPPRSAHHRSTLKQRVARLAGKLANVGCSRSRLLVHLLVLFLVLTASLVGGRMRAASRFDVLSSAFALDGTSSYRAGFARSAHGGAESLVKAPSIETKLMNRPRRDVSLHFVSEGETVSSLAKQYGVDVETIAWANYLPVDEPLRAGQLLIIPPVRGVLHVVRPGDTIEKIAALYQASAQAIVDYNQLSNSSELLVGERLIVPGGRLDSERAQLASRGEKRTPPTDGIVPASLPATEPTPAVAKPEKTPEPTPTPAAAPEPAPTPGPLRPWVYTVQEGDTVLALAMKFGITPETIIWANGLGSAAFITVGQELVILPVSGVLHKVTEGDSLDYIARLYHADVQAIVQANQLADASAISIGQELIVPGGQMPMPAEVEEEPTPEPQTAQEERAPSSQPKPAPQEQGTANEPAPSGGGNWDAVSIASEFLGYPYVWGGSSPAGFDCSGLVYYVYTRRLGIPLPRTAEAQWGAGTHVSYDQLAPGDIVFFRNTYKVGISHVGIYIGGGRFIHAASVAEGVTVSSLGEAYWSARYAGATRVY